MNEMLSGVPRETKSDGEARPEIRRPPVLFDQTQPLLDRLERLLGGPLVTYWLSPTASMAHEDVMALDHVLRRAAIDDQVFLFIKSDGGAGTAALRMTNILRHWARRVTALVPLDAASAATMLAIGADEIHIGPLGYLSAVDTSIRHELSPLDHINDRVSVSHDELVRVVRLWNERSKDTENAANPWGALFGYVHPLVIGAVDRASSLSIKLCTEILAYHLGDRGKANAIARALNEDYPAHGYPITLREAQRIGLSAKPLAPEVDELLIQLSQLYAEMGQRADTDFDPRNYHSNEIRKIVETRSVQLYYQVDKDWHYREAERRWTSLNDRSSWREIRTFAGEQHSKAVHFG
jgi:hypothetical protein